MPAPPPTPVRLLNAPLAAPVSAERAPREPSAVVSVVTWR